MAAGTGQVTLGLNANVFITQMNQVNQTTQTANQTINQLNQTLGQMGSAASSAASGAGALGNQLGGLNGKLTALAGLGVVNALLRLQQTFTAATQEAASFSRQIGLIQTITADSGVGYDQWAAGIRKVSDLLGLPLAETAAGAYDLLSNQVTKAADTFTVLATAGNLAKLTNASVADSVNTLSSVINAYGYTSDSAEQISAKLFTTVDLGRVKLSELASQIGRVAETGKSIGVSLEETNAGLIAITNTGVKTDTAMTLLVNVYQKLLKPTKDLQAIYDELGTGTGEATIKLYGLAGALEIIRQKTGGTAAGVAKVFNEIRGSQGYQILIDQMAAFKNGLAAQDTALERSRAALKVYNETPGAKLQKGLQEFSNELTLGLKTGLLDAVGAVADKFGGIKPVLSELLIASTGIGVAVGTIPVGRLVVSLGRAVTLAYQLQAASVAAGAGLAINPAAAAGVGILVLSGVIAKIGLDIIAARAEAERLYDTLETRGIEVAQQEGVEAAKARAESVDQVKKALEEKQKLILADIAEQRRTLNKLTITLDIDGDALRESLKNAIELGLKAAKDSLKEIDTRLSKALSTADAAKKAIRDTEGSRGDALFGFRRARDQAETGGANEQGIFQRRINELNAEMSRAVKKGDLESYNSSFNKTAGILGEAASATGEDGSLKYYGAENAINELYDQRIAQLGQIAALNERNAKILATQKAEVSDLVKKAEDSGADLFKFSAVDKTGAAKYASPEEEKAAAGKVRDKALADLEALRVNPHVGAEFRGADALAQTSVINQQYQRIVDRADQYLKNQETRQGAVGQQGKLDQSQAQVAQVVAEALKQAQVNAAEANAFGLNAGFAKAKSDASLGALVKEPNKDANFPVFGAEDTGGFDVNRDRLQRARDEALTRSADLANKGALKLASDQLDRVEKIQRELGGLDLRLTSGPVDTQGNRPTFGQGIDAARADLEARRLAERSAQGAQERFGANSRAGPEAFDKMSEVLSHWKSVDQSAAGVTTERTGRAITAIGLAIDGIAAELDRAAGLAASAERISKSRGAPAAPVADQYHGGFGGYFAAGGEPRGVDTRSVMMAPGEFIMNAQSSARFKSQLIAMNQGHNPGSGGGSSTNVGDIHVSVNGGSSSQATLQEIASGLQRGIRQGTIRLGR